MKFYNNFILTWAQSLNQILLLLSLLSLTKTSVKESKEKHR